MSGIPAQLVPPTKEKMMKYANWYYTEQNPGIKLDIYNRGLKSIDKYTIFQIWWGLSSYEFQKLDKYMKRPPDFKDHLERQQCLSEDHQVILESIGGTNITTNPTRNQRSNLYPNSVIAYVKLFSGEIEISLRHREVDNSLFKKFYVHMTEVIKDVATEMEPKWIRWIEHLHYIAQLKEYYPVDKEKAMLARRIEDHDYKLGCALICFNIFNESF
jgi:hypothetical protein